MSTEAVQIALARLLVDPRLRQRWTTDPGGALSEFPLTDREVAMLAGIDAHRLAFTAGGITRARSRTLKRMFATTLRRVGDASIVDRIVTGFVDGDLPLEGRNDADKWVAEGKRFVAHLERLAEDGTVPSTLAGLAQLEWLRADLRYSSAAAIAAAAAGTGPAPGPEAQLRLAAHVRVVELRSDVLASAAGPPSAQAGTVHLALVRRHPDGRSDVFRLNSAAAELYHQCDGTRSVADLTDGDPDRQRQLTEAVRAGLLVSVR
ncbi:hypothetical protein KIF24_31365 [Micromonospora sp. Llam7]|uniref:hypothetical protein n=1 Tax=Micromonospora tarapacensis TaxID=2835305 RepID=UPI001C82C02D|nr:hypothetical protein [Micromonospora tarapacensis]MBX7270081.1 hypothetical protein [Micromonospora tarapacensis]